MASSATSSLSLNTFRGGDSATSPSRMSDHPSRAGKPPNAQPKPALTHTASSRPEKQTNKQTKEAAEEPERKFS